MSDDEKPIDEDFLMRAAEISVEWIDIMPFARALQDEYQRGLRESTAGAEQMKAEYERGQNDYRDNLLRELDARRVPAKEAVKESPKEPEPRKPIANSIEEAPAPKAPKAEPKPRTGAPQPTGTPTTFRMIAIILSEKGPMLVRDVTAVIAERWWPGLTYDRLSPEVSTWIRKGRLDRDQDGKLSVTLHGFKVAKMSALEPAVLAPKKPLVEPLKNVMVPKTPAPSRPAPQPAPQPSMAVGVDFSFNEKKVRLTHREHVVAIKLQGAMGKGHLSGRFLGQCINLSKQSDNEGMVRDLCVVLSSKIEPLGLKVEFFKGFGFVMTEVA